MRFHEFQALVEVENMHAQKEHKLTTHTIGFECNDQDWELLAKYFRLRSSIFVENKKWDLFNEQNHELDQYDKETSHYVLVACEQTGSVLAGARLSPTEHPSFTSPIYRDAASFMIKDAYAGLLDGLPQNLCFEDPPVGDDIWELTRVVALDTGSTKALFETTTCFLESKGVKQCLALGSPAVMRTARLYGCDPVAIGPVVSNGNGDFLAFSCAVNAPVSDP